MKKHIHRFARYTAFVLISSMPPFFDGFDAYADDFDKKSHPSITRVAGRTPLKRHLIKAKKPLLVEDAALVLSGTRSALAALENDNINNALRYLAGVSGKLDVLLAKYPSTAVLNAEVDAEIDDFNGQAENLGEVANIADHLLAEGKFQDARQLLAGLASEVRVSLVGIPLASFQEAVNAAVSLINIGKLESAANMLDDALGTVETTTEIIPLPVINAESSLDEAEKLARKTDLSKSENSQAVLQYAAAAKDKLQLAVLLGYGSQDDYAPLLSQLDRIGEVLGTKDADATWANIKGAFVAIRNKIIKSKP